MMKLRSAVLWAAAFAVASSGATVASGARPAVLSGVRHAQQNQYPDQYPDRARENISARVSDAQVRQILSRIRTDTQAMRATLPSSPRGSYSGDQQPNDVAY